MGCRVKKLRRTKSLRVTNKVIQRTFTILKYSYFLFKAVLVWKSSDWCWRIKVPQEQWIHHRFQIKLLFKKKVASETAGCVSEFPDKLNYTWAVQRALERSFLEVNHLFTNPNCYLLKTEDRTFSRQGPVISSSSRFRKANS